MAIREGLNVLKKGVQFLGGVGVGALGPKGIVLFGILFHRIDRFNLHGVGDRDDNSGDDNSGGDRNSED
jgi:hypothetical protein